MSPDTSSVSGSVHQLPFPVHYAAGELMDIVSANDALKAIELPSWIRDVRWVEHLDSDNEPLLRVMLVVDEAIDVDAIFDELQSVKGLIRDALKTAGIATWVSIVLDSPVAE